MKWLVMKPISLVVGLVASCFVLVTITQPYAQPQRRAPRVVSGLTDIVWSVKFSPDNRTLAIARGPGDAGRVELWDVESGTLRHSIKGFDGAVWSISFAPDGRTLVSASGGLHSNKIQEKLARRNGIPFVELKWWDTETGDLKQRVELPGEDRVSLMAVHSPDGRSLATVEYRAAMAFSGFGSFDPGIGPNRFPFLSSARYDADLKLLDAQTGEVRLKLKGSIGGYEMPLYGGYSLSDLFSMFVTNQHRQLLAFSPDGQLVAAWNTKEVKLWNTATGEEVRRLKDFKGRLSAVTFSPDGRRVAAAITRFSFKDNRPDFRSEIRTWDVATGTPKQVLPVSTQSISSLVFALSGQQLLIGGMHRDDTRSFATLELADLQTGSLGSIEAHEEGTASSVVLSPNGQMVAFQTDASSLHLIDTQTWKIKQTFNETSDGGSGSTVARRFLLSVKSVMALAFSPDGKIVSGEIEQGGIKLWDTRTGEVKKQLADHADTGSMAATSLDGSMLAEVGGDDETPRLWNVTSGEKKDFSASDGSVSAIALSPDGQRLAVAHPNRIILLNTATAEVIQKLTVQQTKVDWLSFSTDGRTLATASEDGTIQTWDLANGQITKTITAGGKITALHFAPTNRILASATQDGTVSLWDLQTGALSLQLKKHSRAVNAIAFSPDGNLMATGGDDRRVTIWEAATGKARRTLKGQDLTVTSLAFSPDGTLLASGGGNASVVLWDVRTGELNRVLK
jgi:WD40 repeat protein